MGGAEDFGVGLGEVVPLGDAPSRLGDPDSEGKAFVGDGIVHAGVGVTIIGALVSGLGAPDEDGAVAADRVYLHHLKRLCIFAFS